MKKFPPHFLLFFVTSCILFAYCHSIKDNGYRNFDIRITFCDNRRDTVMNTYFPYVPSANYINNDRAAAPTFMTMGEPSGEGKIWMNVCDIQVLKEYN